MSAEFEMPLKSSAAGLQLGSSGVFSNQSSPLLGSSKFAHLVSWNCRSLLHHQRKQTKEAFVRKELLPSTHVLDLQEVHGNSTDMRLFFSQFRNSLHVFFSALGLPPGQQAHAGVAMLVAHTTADLGDITSRVLVAGRPLELDVVRGDFRLSHLNMHFHDFSDD